MNYVAAEEIPSFSIVLETENLANADIHGLAKSLASLVNQDVSPTRANEVLLIDSGDTPPELLRQLCQQYPWIQVHPAPLTAGYYKAKMIGAELATGDIVVYCDSDCTYEPHWLRTLLATFAQSNEIQVVAGETTTRGVGPYGTAMALTYIFPQYSGEKQLVPTAQYFLNNVAFRRSFLLRYPMPTDLPLYRGNCVIHARQLRLNGQTIWRQPHARATHAAPDGLSHFFWRFLLIGHDLYWQSQILSQDDRPAVKSSSHKTNPNGDANASDRDPVTSFQGKISIFFDRIRKMVRNDRRHLLYLPLSIPIATASVLLIFTGYLITAARPNLLLKAYDRVLEQPSN